MSKQRTRTFVTQILRKTCSSLVKIIPDGENNFTQNKYNKLPKIGAENMWVFWQKTVQKSKYGILYSSITWCRPDRYANSKLIIKTLFLYYIKRM